MNKFIQNSNLPLKRIDFQLVPIVKILLLVDVGGAAAAARLTRRPLMKTLKQALMMEDDVLRRVHRRKRQRSKGPQGGRHLEPTKEMGM